VSRAWLSCCADRRKRRGAADALNRLTRFRRGTLNDTKDDLTVSLYEQEWHDAEGALTLDKLGNWDAMRLDADGDDTAQSMTTTSRGHNLANEYTALNGASAYQHDDNGNLTDDETNTYLYDFANHLVCAVRQSDSDTIAEYTYDALGRRVKKVVSDVSDTLDGTTLFYYDDLRVIEKGELDGQAAYVATHQHVWGLYLDEQLLYDFDAHADGNFDAIDEANGDKRYYVTHDFLYSATAVLDSSGTVLERYDYTPYGAVTFWSADYSDTDDETQVHNDFLFTGQMYDAETGLYHYKARGYHPILGRFHQHDPAHYAYGSNLYLYVDGLPSAIVDPIGLGDYYLDVDQDEPLPDVLVYTVKVKKDRGFWYRSKTIAEVNLVLNRYWLDGTAWYRLSLGRRGGLHLRRDTFDQWLQRMDDLYRLVEAAPAGAEGFMWWFLDEMPAEIYKVGSPNVSDEIWQCVQAYLSDVRKGWQRAAAMVRDQLRASMYQWLAISAAMMASGAYQMFATTPAPGPSPRGALGRGSTADPARGSHVAQNLREQLAISQAMANPGRGRGLVVPMTDPRWPAGEGWIKMQQVIKPGGAKIVVHYVYNVVTGAVDDFKLVGLVAR